MALLTLRDITLAFGGCAVLQAPETEPPRCRKGARRFRLQLKPNVISVIYRSIRKFTEL